MERAPYLAVVRRGNTKVYGFLKDYFEAQGLVHVIWDRRIARRRTRGKRNGAERRHGERRHRPPDTWDTLGFVLVRQDR